VQARAQISRAAAHYAERNSAFTEALAARGIRTVSTDGLSLWVQLDIPARAAAERLMRRGWLARPGDEFLLDETAGPSRHLRLTVHDLTDAEAARLVDDLAAAAVRG
jgi:DNA-binding transcriptional MocR family regulator